MIVTDAQRALILDALVDPKPFYGEGFHEFPAHQLILFAGRDPIRIDLSKGAASTAELERLADACQAATFGRNQSYWKAGKLDNTDFALNLEVLTSGLLDKVHEALFGWEAQSRDVHAELYNLNVYLLTFATPHESEQLALRHDGREYIHDARGSTRYGSDQQVSWVAFFSDVEHEVLPVTPGHRVTLTYNLYFGTGKEYRVRPMTSNSLVRAFKAVLADPTFMADGGRLGFGLKHQYPIPTDDTNSDFLDGTAQSLKGMDSALFNSIEAAGLAPKLRLWYTVDDVCYGGEYVLPYIWEAKGSKKVRNLEREFPDEHKIAPGDNDEEDDPRFKNFVWIIKHNSKTSVPSLYLYTATSLPFRMLMAIWFW